MTLDCSLIQLYRARPLTSFQELKEMLVDPLPVGSSLLVRNLCSASIFVIPHARVFQAILDTCHSGTLLHLPHYHCNDVYVPWQSKDRSKGNRRTMTKQIKSSWLSDTRSTHYSSVP